MTLTRDNIETAREMCMAEMNAIANAMLDTTPLTQDYELVAYFEQIERRLHSNIESLRRIESGAWKPASEKRCNVCGHLGLGVHECDK